MGFQLVPMIKSHRVQNDLGRTEEEEIWEDIETFTYNRLRGTSALWDFCKPKMPRPAHRGAKVATAAPLAQMPMRGVKTKPLRPPVMKRDRFDTVEEVKASATRKASNATVSEKPKKPCKTCGGRKKH